MKTLILDEPGTLRLGRTSPPKRPGLGEVLVQVHRVGVCGTDLHAYRGHQPYFSYPRILGHELGVEVLETGPDVRGVRQGDRCAVEPYLSCGACVACRQGKTNCCATLLVLGVHTDGGMRERIVVPARLLHRSETLSFEQLALVETLAIGAHAVRRALVRPGETALVIGAGPIGFGTMQFAKAAGARVFAADTDPSRLDFCKRLGFPVAAPPSDASNRTDLSEWARENEPTLVFDATGAIDSMNRCLDLASSGGKIVFVGLSREAFSYPHPEFHRKEMMLLSSRNSTAEDFRRVMAVMETREIDTSLWITHRVSPEKLIEAMPVWSEPGSGVLKGVVEL